MMRWFRTYLASLSVFALGGLFAGTLLAQSDFRPDRLLIKPRAEAGEQLRTFHQNKQVRIRREFPSLDNIQVLELPEGLSVTAALDQYKASGLVEFAEPDYYLHPVLVPNDPYYSGGVLWHLNNTGQSGGLPDADVDAPEGWDTTCTASNVIVAVIDSGVRYTHEDLAANMWCNPGEIPGNNLDDDGNGWIDDVYGINAAANTGNPIDLAGHGTQVAGVIGAVGNNGIGVSGIAWRIQLMACRFFDDNNNGAISDAVQAIDYARLNGAKVMNASFITTGYSSTLYSAILNCRSAGIVFVAAAGNDAANNDTTAYYPANYNLDNIVTVAATTRTDDLAEYSNYGASSVDIAAPGSSIITTYNSSDSAYVSSSGTSFSAPLVAGAFALMKTRYPSETYLQLINRVYAASDPLPTLSGKCATGARLNVARALGPSIIADFDATPISGSAPLQVNFTDRSFGSITNWVWDFGDGTASNEQSPVHTYTRQGTYAVHLAIRNSLGLSDTATTNIAVVANYQISTLPYAWIDTTGMGQLSLSNDGVSSAQALPFIFRFYGFDYNQLYVSANGLVGFDSQNLTTAANSDLPNAATPNNIICPFWDDLNPGGGGSVRFGIVGSPPNRKAVISWNGVPYNGGPPANYTFQAILEEGTYRILFQYQNVVPGKGAGNQGQSATVGIENSAGTVAAKFSYNGSTLLANNTAVSFAPATDPGTPQPALLSVSSTPPANTFSLVLKAEPSQQYVIEASTDMLQWSAVSTNLTGSDGTLIYSDSNYLQKPKRFFRGKRYP